MSASHVVAATVMSKLKDKLISGLTNDEDAVYDKASSEGLVGARSTATGKKDRARDLMVAIIERVETDTTSDPNPLDVFMTILRSRENLKYLAKEIEVELIKLTGSESADFHAQSSTSGDCGIQYAPYRSSINTDSHPRLGAGGSDPHCSQHATQKFASPPHTTQLQSSVELEEEIQKHTLHQEPIPVAETSSPSKSVEDEYQKGNKDVLLASDTGSYPYRVSNNDTHSEASTSKLKEEMRRNENLNAELLDQIDQKWKAIKLSEHNWEREHMERQKNVKLNNELEKCKEERERSVIALEGQLEKCEKDLEEMTRKKHELENQLKKCEEEREGSVLELERQLEKCKKALVEMTTKKHELESQLEKCKEGRIVFELRIELVKYKPKLEEQKRNEHEFESKHKEHESELDVMKRNS